MTAAVTDSELRERLACLEYELCMTIAALDRRDEGEEAALPAAPAPVPASQARREMPAAPSPAPPRRIARDAGSVSDFLGGRALAWIGGVATLLGIVLLLVLAISHGWIGREARVALAAGASVVWMLAGVRLHARRGRTEAAVVMVGAATAGMFATLIVAGEVYGLIPAPVAVVGSMVVGALATALAIRWAGIPIAVLGLLGGLLSPVLVSAPSDATTIGVLALGTACAMWVVLWRRWAWLALAAMVVAGPQWAYWALSDHSSLARLAVVAVFTALGLAGAVFLQLRSDEENVAGLAAALALLNALFAGLVGRVALGSAGGDWWLAALGAAHVAVCVWPRPRIRIHDTLRRLLLAVGVVCADVAVGLGLHGLAQSAAWGVAALGFTWLARRSGADPADGPWLGAGLAAHVTLVLIGALFALPPSQVTSAPQVAGLASVAMVAVVCLLSGRVAQRWGGAARIALESLGLAAIAYLTLATLSGAPLVAAWAGEAAALAEIGRRSHDRHALAAAGCFLAGATAYAIAFEVPPTALIQGVASLSGAAIALGALALASLRVGLAQPAGSRLRLGMLAGAGVALLSLASVAIVTAFQPGAGAGTTVFVSLGVRQTGQVLLSGLWAIAGVAGLIVGLRRNSVPLRLGMLGLLLITVVKVFLFDLSVLTSIYRVSSLFVLGALLLIGAFAYQRLRPPPAPDMRTVHPSQR
ncbi:MAG TPA: DUF2339 domain-containing protein [Solirubrobacteraceae bacterium]|nr:DUF2339 domain-containing protein [Solirubrobacteraceae bacterium]